MNDTQWLADDGRLLKDLRIAAGWDLHDFARSASISAAQLRQLEDGGSGLFYSPRIQFQMGRRLLLKLGADVVRTHAEPMADTPTPPVTAAPERTRAAGLRWAIALAGVGILVSAVYGVSHRLSAPSEAPSPVLVNSAPPPPVVATAEPVVAPTPEPVQPTPQPVTANCRWDDGPGSSLMPPGVDKPSTYVHVVALADVSLCVQDRTQTITQVNLKLGEKATVRGTAPWRIHTPQWAAVSLYFQGYRVPVPDSATWVTLRPRPMPLADVDTPANESKPTP
ncbi:MAG: hypothetical protein RL297_1120 [Pseudomonadota bacterium]|jgi:hypothetical protein